MLQRSDLELEIAILNAVHLLATTEFEKEQNPYPVLSVSGAAAYLAKTPERIAAAYKVLAKREEIYIYWAGGDWRATLAPKGLRRLDNQRGLHQPLSTM